MNQPTDPGAVILYQCGLGCFVSDGDDWKQPVAYDGILYIRVLWNARELAHRECFGISADELPDYIMQAREVD